MRNSAVSAVALLLAGVLAGSALAHTTLVFASPGPGTRVSGAVDRIQLGFADPIFEPTVTLIAPDGRSIPGRIEMIDERTLAFVHEGMDEPGEYVVQYRVLAPDDDDQPELASAFAFTYLGGASGSNWLYFAGVALGLAGLGGVIAWRVTRVVPPEQPTESG